MTYTTQNSDWTATELPVVNAAYDRLLAERIDEDTSDEDREQIAKSVGDDVNNAWVEGITADEIVAKVRGGHV